MSHIHRYGQEKDCLIFNSVTTNTREGRVLGKLFERIEEIEKALDPKRTGKVFNVLGEVFPGNQLEKMLRDMYARNQMTEDLIKQRIIEQVDVDHFRSITNSTLEGLAKRELNLSAIVGKGRDPRAPAGSRSDCKASSLRQPRSRALRLTSKEKGNIPTARRVCRAICGRLPAVEWTVRAVPSSRWSLPGRERCHLRSG